MVAQTIDERIAHFTQVGQNNIIKYTDSNPHGIEVGDFLDPDSSIQMDPNSVATYLLNANGISAENDTAMYAIVRAMFGGNQKGDQKFENLFRRRDTAYDRASILTAWGESYNRWMNGAEGELLERTLMHQGDEVAVPVYKALSQMMNRYWLDVAKDGLPKSLRNYGYQLSRQEQSPETSN